MKTTTRVADSLARMLGLPPSRSTRHAATSETNAAGTAMPIHERYS